MCVLSLEMTWHFSGGFHLNQMMCYVRIYLFLAWLLSLATTTLRYLHADAHIDGSFPSMLTASSLCRPWGVLAARHGWTAFSFYEESGSEHCVQTFAFISLAEKPGSGEAGSHGRCDVYIF